MPSLTWCTLFACLTTLKICFRQNSTKPKILLMGTFRNCGLFFPATFNLAYLGSFIMFHLLPCLTTFNIVVYLNESELNNLNVVFCQYASRCILSAT